MRKRRDIEKKAGQPNSFIRNEGHRAVRIIVETFGVDTERYLKELLEKDKTI